VLSTRLSATRSLTSAPLAGCTARNTTGHKGSLTVVLLSLLGMITLSCLRSCSGSFVPTVRSHGSLESKRILSHNFHRLAFASTNGFGVDFARNVAQTVHPSVALVTPMGVRNMTSQGSGFVVDWKDDYPSESRSVYLLTAAHVAAPGLQLTVLFPSQGATPHSATVVGRNAQSDVALIRIELNDTEATDLELVGKPLQLWTQEKVDVGTLSFASGYPAGITGGPAMTMGIICGMASGFPGYGHAPQQRSNDDDQKNTNETSFARAHANTTTFVVTDAAMTGGMSGGPLVDADGVVLGMNALIRTDMRALGNYAVSASTCQEFLTRLAEEREQSRLLQNSASSPTPLTFGFRVMLYNDRMNKRERVARILKEVANIDETDANSIMMSAHTTGSGVVREFPGGDRVEADSFCDALRRQDVLVEVEEITR
jgi:S1-C subfamily serine protease/ATP-dependent Clp protease adapter protein ClpS